MGWGDKRILTGARRAMRIATAVSTGYTVSVSGHDRASHEDMIARQLARTDKDDEICNSCQDFHGVSSFSQNLGAKKI